MIVAMTLGMMSGVLFGTVVGVILHGDLLVSTIISILIGLSIGFITGIPFSLFAVIDGSVSGLMGGMMGAMLGEMVTMSNPDTMLKILTLFTVMIFMLVSYETEKKLQEANKKGFFFISKYPYLSLFITIVFFFLLKNVEIIQ
ncbi:hypothetical protein GCM10008025_30010 [Ornithinibacillus halotolerans]|uniref:Uncharacterized protein n=2 Tax=Ornithinibacillus halotolerans TaxID=1274357 RepID=A0A916S546_9BACI|nr:hypothetical protein GCM10008025_30010 [Ornithinibacillus halotolerans]